jgi:hypothetical protein
MPQHDLVSRSFKPLRVHGAIQGSIFEGETPMRRLAMAAAAALILAAAPAPRRDVSQLAWLAGAWATQASSPAEQWTEERWSPPRGGVMLGSSLSGKGGEANWFEYMRLARDQKGAIHYWASPGGKPAVPFLLVSLSDREAVFENPSNDYPTRIVYRRSGRILHATISGPDGANPQSWRYRMMGR